jgi:acyl-CoA reductase-like NAD-dependent aldehyde dehydrogenase
MCMAVKRVYVAESRYDELLAALAERARSARIGNGSDKGVQLGPISNQPQYERVTEAELRGNSDQPKHR